MLGFKKKVTVQSFWQPRLDGMFSGKNEPGWDALKASFNDPALEEVEPVVFYGHMQAMTIEIVSAGIAKGCSMEVSTSSRLFVSEFMKSRNRTDVDDLVRRYSSAFGSSFTDGIRPMVELFSKEVSGSGLAPSTLEALHRTLYLLLGEVRNLLGPLKLVAFPRNGEELSELRRSLAASTPKEYRADYGSLFVPPSIDAAAIRASMTKEESLNFEDLLGRLQKWHESMIEKGTLSFHPEGRASLWGAALAKIADYYREIGRNDRAFYFTSAAWNLSRYPVFAFNAGMLAMAAGDIANGKNFLQTYLDEYPKALTTPSLRLVDPEVTEEELERLARIAHSKLATVGSM